MSDIALGGEPTLPRVVDRRPSAEAAIPDAQSATPPVDMASSTRTRRRLPFLGTIGAVDFRGLDFDLTPAEISEDLDYGRD